MSDYPAGYKFVVPSEGQYGNRLKPLTANMFRLAGQTLTVKEKCGWTNDWYFVEENGWLWPVASCEEATSGGSYTITFDVHKCKEGETPLMGYVICKVCGKNMREFNWRKE